MIPKEKIAHRIALLGIRALLINKMVRPSRVVGDIKTRRPSWPSARLRVTPVCRRAVSALASRTQLASSRTDLERSLSAESAATPQPRNPAPMLVPETSTVKICQARATTMRVNRLEGSLMIEWE